MKKILTTVSFFLIFTISFGQTIYEPQILILSPNEVTYDKVFEKEITGYNSSIKNNNIVAEQEKLLQSTDFAKQPANIQKMMQDEVAYSKNLDFFKQASVISQQF
ncbi:MAG TPA: hypothetical protein VFF57_13200 [Hanamia sp.]|nr:hypothetical protein [Hanamia sp.]